MSQTLTYCIKTCKDKEMLKKYSFVNVDLFLKEGFNVLSVSLIIVYYI